jgi:hypothetical protein
MVCSERKNAAPDGFLQLQWKAFAEINPVLHKPSSQFSHGAGLVASDNKHNGGKQGGEPRGTDGSGDF